MYIIHYVTRFFNASNQVNKCQLVPINPKGTWAETKILWKSVFAQENTMWHSQWSYYSTCLPVYLSKIQATGNDSTPSLSFL